MADDSQRGDLPEQFIGEVPESFALAFKQGYLGDPEVVSSLVGGFCASAESLLHNMGSGATSKARFVDRSKALVRQYADVFAGRNPVYQTIAGFNERSLPNKLRVDLGEFWQFNRKNWDDDPVCVLFEWLFVHTAESVKRADGDDDLLEIMLKPVVEGAVKILLDIERRAY
jgi:hypothetical protein